MKTFNRQNTIVGWIVFSIAFVVYWLTMEPTASFWDCGEFIAASYKLQVPHPPGAPLFLLIGRLFSFLAFGDVSKVAYWINFSSVLAGAFTSMFLFWSIVLLAIKFFKDQERKTISIFGAGIVGALTYTFCDSAWFSAVEAEVYSMSSFFTAFVFWAMLRWEIIEDDAKANRWLIFIFYLMGLSIGVHLLNLVTIPSLALIYYFKKFRPSRMGIAVTLATSLVIVFVINELIIPGLPSWAGAWEIFFVNSAGLPFGSGVILFGSIVMATLIVSVLYSQRKRNVILNTFLLALTFILIGYSSYVMVMIRSGFNPPINENDPSDIVSFVKYLKREQYGTRPLLYGPYFYARVENWEEGAPVYKKGKEKYEVTDHKFTGRYNPREETILPRIWSSDDSDQKSYRNILGLKENEKPTFADNIRFMFTHQIGWMYVRYFFFNFAGRESDDASANWFGPSHWFKELPQMLSENKGRNNYFMIPFVLGLVGMYFQLVRNTKNFFVLSLLFILTGVALVIYLNSPPGEPRARDYIYVGSYYAYSCWVGFAVLAFAELFKKLFSNVKVAGVSALVVCLSAPTIMLAQNLNDHNRAGRYFSIDTAVNDLQSCAPDSILFTGGDNDTFVQWYVQEVEGIRTDVRVVVASYFNTAWYIGQTMRQTNRSQPFPYTLTSHHYREGGPNNPYLPYYDAGIKSMDLKQYLDLLKKEHKGLRVHPTNNVIPTRDIVLRVDVEKVKSLKIVPPSLAELIIPEMHLKLEGQYLEIKDLAFLDILATSDWSRPVYVTPTALRQFKVDLTPYVVREGNVYRVLPVLNPNSDDDLVNTRDGYDRVVNKFQFRGLNDSTSYFSDDYKRAVQNHRNNLNKLAIGLLQEGDSQKAKEIVNLSLERMPDEAIRYDAANLETIQILFATGETEKAIDIADTMKRRSYDLAKYYFREKQFGSDLNLNMAILGEIARIYYVNKEIEKAEEIEVLYSELAESMRRSDM
jgi:tetratricopeptide (TPR) repeat protein